MEENKKLGLPSVVATGVGVIVATSCLLSLGQGAGLIGTPFIIAMIIACFLNILAAASIAELNALMPNLTGGLAQYTLACMGPFITILIMVGGYLFGNTIVGSVEIALLGNTLTEIFPESGLDAGMISIVSLVLLVIVNLFGVDIFAKVQNLVAYGLIGSIVILGTMGMLKVGTGEVISQPAVVAGDLNSILGMSGLAFFLFIASEYVVPISKDVRNAKRNVPLGMMLSLIIILVMQSILVLGFKNYTPWEALASSASPHILYGSLLLGKVGMVWMGVVAILAVISSVNSNLAGLSHIASGMAKIGLLPPVFMKTNRRGAPYVGILLIGIMILGINITGLTTTNELFIMILSASVILMLAYTIVHINVIIFRNKIPKAPRNFKVPGGVSMPIVGIIGTLWMIWNIAEDAAARNQIYTIVGVMFLVIGVYAFIWLKSFRKVALFKSIPIERVMAMEHELYHEKRREAKISTKSISV